jgi:hypothetical protein
MKPEARAALERACARLDRLDLYPRPVDIGRVRVLTVPLFFKLPRLRRYGGYALWRTILLKRPPGRGSSDDLVTHELCHIWQGQHRRFRMLLAYATTRYRDNPYEREARWAVTSTRPAPATATPANPVSEASQAAPSATESTEGGPGMARSS